MSQDILIFDRNLLLQKRSNARLNKADFLIKRSLEDIQERLNETTKDFTSTLYLGQRDYPLSTDLIYQHKIERVIETELFFNNSNSNNIQIIVDEENLPFANEKFDLIISLLNLHKVNDLPGCLIQLRNSLKPNGILIASMLGEKTLPELRATLAKTEIEHCGGISPRMMPLIELKQLGSLLQRAKFNMPVIDKDHVEIHYSNPLELLYDLRNMGETNIMLNRNKKYVGKEFWKKFRKNYINDFCTEDNLYSASFEILTFIAVK
ncbi:MAG: class I SAM-dependent methyltransferase [Rickettsiales bacterium]|jgi:SAM-dependent methyltransferase|nr:class I SAM-dependent methyltransferase [Rickettsiales bacterium]